jgi:hypothetical protein
MATASLEDVAVRLGRELSEPEKAQAQVLLAAAELMLVDRVPELLSTVDRARVVMVEAAMVVRVLRNPEGLSQETDGNYSYMIHNDGVSPGRLTVYSEEWRLLGVSTSGIGVLSPKIRIPWPRPEPRW